eukprot:TRINITY_DN7800_c0_g1_i4.p1 TRINITY_DN7800_c0_g1~~TRINITY_DN7800_c0_g1_i4.p1  ORF type:complete len:220 (-),score=96.42 TRINITY_DN7800_c0_g1_i4:2658-3317(-)
MSMFSGLGNQISGFVAQKMGKGEGAPPEGGEPVQQEMMINENGEEVPVNPQAGQGGAAGGAMGFAQGLMAKAAAAGSGIKEKAGGLGGLQAPFGGGEGGEQQMMAAEPVYNEQGELIDPNTGLPPVEGMEGQGGAQPGAMGFAAGLMMKAHSLKEGVQQKSAGMNLGQVGGLATGVMGQVQGIIPGMKREEEVPEPMPQEEVYQEYQDQQYTEEQYVQQ